MRLLARQAHHRRRFLEPKRVVGIIYLLAVMATRHFKLYLLRCRLQVKRGAGFGVLAIERTDGGDAVQRDPHADHDLAGGDVDPGDALSHGVLNLGRSRRQ
jgi:hypothetical protein